MSGDNAGSFTQDDQRPIGSELSVRTLLSIPAAAAIALGFIYALGALTRSLALAHAGISAQAAFPLIPIQQHLAAGIQLLVQPAVVRILLLAVVSFGVGIVVGWFAGQRAAKREPSRVKAGADQGLPTWVYVAATFLLGATVSRPVTAAGLAVGGILCGVVVFALASPAHIRQGLWRAHLSPSLVLVLVIVFVGTAALTVDLISPPPLSTAYLETTSRGEVAGAFVTVADGTWYLGGSHHQLLAIDQSQVRSATVVSNHRKPDDPANESLLRMLFG